jgi:hypothetical protein
MSKKTPDAAPPPKGSEEDRRFKSLLRKLVAVPRSEVEEKRAAHNARRASRKARKKEPSGP